jgi:hypothetical protein
MKRHYRAPPRRWWRRRRRQLVHQATRLVYQNPACVRYSFRFSGLATGQSRLPPSLTRKGVIDAELLSAEGAVAEVLGVVGEVALGRVRQAVGRWLTRKCC